MYLHHPLWLLPLMAVGRGGARKSSHKHRDYQYNDDIEEYYDDDYDYGNIQHDRNNQPPYQMYHDTQQLPKRNKLLIIVLGGFKSNYLDMYRDRTGRYLDGFHQFMSEGVRTRYLKSVFPAESFPAWQTIQTGLYPESHGIVGNQFYDHSIHHQTKSTCQAFFNIDDERATSNMKWWQKDGVEPIWATAAKQNVNFATFLWGRCDISYEGVKRYKPAYCENYYSADLTKTLSINVDKALNKLAGGLDAAIIYDSMLEKAAEDYGPFSKEMDEKLRQLDASLVHLESRLNHTRMSRHVNVVILSDHGMSYGHHPAQDDVLIKKIKLTKYMRSGTYRWIVGSGAHAGVYPRGPEFREEIINKLRNVDGLLVWDRKDIPEEYHYKNSKNTPPILVLAKPQNIILLSPPEYQKPDGGRCSGNGRSPLKRQSHYRSVHRVMDQMRKGLAGYDPDEEDMRGIFMAKGPDFKDDGGVYPEIELVDVYQIFTKLLNIPAQPNNGTWANVMDLLMDPSGGSRVASMSLPPIVVSIVISLVTNFRTFLGS